MNEEQITKYTEEVVRLLVTSNIVQINDRRRAFGIVKQALEGESMREQSSMLKFFQPKTIEKNIVRAKPAGEEPPTPQP